MSYRMALHLSVWTSNATGCSNNSITNIPEIEHHRFELFYDSHSCKGEKCGESCAGRDRYSH